MNCPYCNIQFEKKFETQKFCTPRCRERFQKKGRYLKRYRPPGEVPKNQPMTTEPRTCKGCSVELKVPRVANQTYCTPLCATRARQRRNSRDRRSSQPYTRARHQLQKRFAGIMKDKKIPPPYGIASFSNATNESVKLHFQSKFEDGMSWDNYNRKGWHIDHIVPCSRFDLLREDHRRVCFHLENLRPAWALDNAVKGASIHHYLISEKLREMCNDIGVDLS